MRIMVLFIALLSAVSAAWAQHKVVINVDFNRSPVGSPPNVLDYQPGSVNTLPQGISRSERNVITVVASAGGLTDKPVLFHKGEEIPRLPALRFFNSKNAVAGANVCIEYDCSVTRFTPGPHWPGFEALLNMNIIDNDGQVAVHLAMLTSEKDGAFGGFGSEFKLGSELQWKRDQPNHVVMLLDLKTGDASLRINDVIAADKTRIDGLAGRAIRIIEFRDGTGFGAHDGLFDAALDHFKVTISQ